MTRRRYVLRRAAAQYIASNHSGDNSQKYIESTRKKEFNNT